MLVEWSRREDLNLQRAVYKTATLPLSYVGPKKKRGAGRPLLRSNLPLTMLH